jgi:hypothetical protein
MEESVMSRRTALRASGGALCLILAAFAVLLARDIWRVQDALEDGDRQAQATAVDSGVWSVDTRLPFGLARDVLGVDDDLAFRSVLAQGRAQSARPANDDEVRRRLPVKRALERLGADRDPVRAAAAVNLLGVIYSTDPNDPDRPAAEKALEALVRAVQLDPDNEVAKANLELFLQQQDPGLRGRRGAAAGELPGSSGAGLRAGGRGY